MNITKNRDTVTITDTELQEILQQVIAAKLQRRMRRIVTVDVKPVQWLGVVDTQPIVTIVAELE